jgi:hypothetical protein
MRSSLNHDTQAARGQLKDAHLDQVQPDVSLVVGVSADVLGHSLSGGERVIGKKHELSEASRSKVQWPVTNPGN